MDNKTDLDYQAGQDDREEGADEDRQQKPADGSKPDETHQPEGAGGEEEQQQDIPEQVLRSMSSSSYRRQTAQRMAVLCSSDAYHSTLPPLLLVEGVPDPSGDVIRRVMASMRTIPTAVRTASMRSLRWAPESGARRRGSCRLRDAHPLSERRYAPHQGGGARCNRTGTWCKQHDAHGQHAVAQGPPDEFELPEDMQLDGDGGAGQEDGGSEDGQQEGMEADVPEDGGALPEQDIQERQPQPDADEAKSGSFAVLQSHQTSVCRPCMDCCSTTTALRQPAVKVSPACVGVSEDGDGEETAAEGPEEGAGAEDGAGAEGSAEQAGLAPEEVEEEPAAGEEDEDLEAQRTGVLHASIRKQGLLCRVLVADWLPCHFHHKLRMCLRRRL